MGVHKEHCIREGDAGHQRHQIQMQQIRGWVQERWTSPRIQMGSPLGSS